MSPTQQSNLGRLAPNTRLVRDLIVSSAIRCVSLAADGPSLLNGTTGHLEHEACRASRSFEDWAGW